MSTHSFANLPLSAEMLKNLESIGYQQMTPIQAKSLPYILNKQDVIAKAKTGSGKTAAFALGVLSRLNPSLIQAQAMVICPTRELADQVSKEIRRLARLMPNVRVLTLCGGKPFRMQAESLYNGAQILVGTPGRILDHLKRKTLYLGKLQTLVLDEADRMLDMGFHDDMLEIIKQTPASRQTLLFSATYPDSITQMSQLLQKSPVDVSFETHDESTQILELAYQSADVEKYDALLAVLGHYQEKSAIIFCRTKRQCDDVAILLCEKNYHALSIHSDYEQREREEILLQFANQSCSILVATDVAARGIDIKALPLVINYDLPSDPESYVHRIGRTGRCGQEGVAISLFNEKEKFKLKTIEEYTQKPIKQLEQTMLSQPSIPIMPPPMRTLCINAGKKNKMRPGDILGALTGDGALKGDEVGKIDIFDFHSYVAIKRSAASPLLQRLQGKIKGRAFKLRFLDNP
ncbi:ATP-dependent RNA helicase DbpA [Candidatus Berkiella aquae]|nr:ATP-dependent RNA helicase DbpA [Candidatus Berkiella aquae]MCS5711592.1 ATP-dependent RNA helicase DbpA [Candidatus Berkiella aquae]